MATRASGVFIRSTQIGQGQDLAGDFAPLALLAFNQRRRIASARLRDLNGVLVSLASPPQGHAT